MNALALALAMSLGPRVDTPLPSPVQQTATAVRLAKIAEREAIIVKNAALTTSLLLLETPAENRTPSWFATYAAAIERRDRTEDGYTTAAARLLRAEADLVRVVLEYRGLYGP